MERLTKRWEKNGSHYHCLVACEESCINNGHTSCYCDPITEVRLKLAAYEDTGKTPEQIAERTKAQQELKDMLDDLISVGNNDGAETYTTGYRNGYRNGRIELLKYILQIPDGTCEAAEAALKEREQNG